MRVERIDLWHVAVPLPAPFRPAWIPGFRQTENRFTLLRVATSDGIEGWSAVPELGREREGIESLLGPYLLGERADDLESIRQRVREVGYLGIRAGWIEPAFWDIVGKARGRPVWSLLGGQGGRVRLYASTGEVRDSTARAREVEARLAEGFHAVKVRVHAATLEEDVAHIRETRRAVGDAAVLAVDANQGWRVAAVADVPAWDAARARAFCEEAGHLGFAWVEEPLPMDDDEGLAALSASVSVPIAGGELDGRGVRGFARMMERGCLGIYQPDAIFAGGIAEAWAIARRARAAGKLFTPHTWTNGIGFAVNLHVYAACADRERTLLEYPIDPPGWVPEVRDGILSAPWIHERGEMAVPDRPGLGFEIDRRALRRHGRRFAVATRLRVAVGAIWDKGIRTAREIGAARDARLARRSKEVDRVAAEGRDPWTGCLESL